MGVMVTATGLLTLSNYSPTIRLSAKEVNIIVQALRIAEEAGSIEDYAKKSEIENLKTKLQNVK